MITVDRGDSSGSCREINNWLSGDGCDSLGEEVQLKMARSVVSLSLFDGCTNVLTCSGIPIPPGSKRHVTRLLTSDKLSRNFIDRRNSGRPMKIQVRDAFDNVVTGWLEQHFFHQGLTLVNVERQSLDVNVVHLDHEIEILPSSSLAGIELLDSGKPTVTGGVLTEHSSTSEAGIELSHSTCKISKAGDGGPLFDGDGNFVGMNLFSDTDRGAFMRRSVVIEKLEQFHKRVELLSCRKRRRRGQRTPGPQRHCACYPEGTEHTSKDCLQKDLDSLGYPKPDDDGMVLVNSFEETFGEEYDCGQGVWGTLGETISKHLSQCVVALASYKGDRRYFACSGIVTKLNGCTVVLTSASLVRDHFDENKADENLRIDVLLTDKQRTQGTLQHYHMHYNIAVVNFKGSCALPTVNLYDPGAHRSSQVAAVGRCFESGILMATRGILTRWHWRSTFDCSVMPYSSCEITKAGIGGPVVDFEGKFLGLNFYDKKEGTPFLPRPMVLLVLEHFEKKEIVAEVDDDGYTNRWPVPKPFWKRPGTT